MKNKILQESGEKIIPTLTAGVKEAQEGREAEDEHHNSANCYA